MSDLVCVSIDQIVHSDRLMKWKVFMSGGTPDYIKRLESTFVDPLHNTTFRDGWNMETWGSYVSVE